MRSEDRDREPWRSDANLIGEDIRLRVGCYNLFDVDPPKVNGSASGYEIVHDPGDRMIYAKLSGVHSADRIGRRIRRESAPPARERMERAAEFLRSTDWPLAEIAERVGYDSQFAFNRAFKRHHHEAPGAFRRHAHVMAPALRAA